MAFSGYVVTVSYNGKYRSHTCISQGSSIKELKNHPTIIVGAEPGIPTPLKDQFPRITRPSLSTIREAIDFYPSLGLTIYLTMKDFANLLKINAAVLTYTLIFYMAYLPLS